MHNYDILRRPIVTEKSTAAMAQRKYGFEVLKGASKTKVKEAVQQAFGVDVTQVNMITVHGKTRRRGSHITISPSWRKAIVTLKAGEKIELFEGV